MAKRGITAGFVMSDEHRSKIANSQILNRLIAAANGEIEMTSTQASIGLGLMKKVLPDLQAIDNKHSGNIDSTVTFQTIYEKPRDS